MTREAKTDRTKTGDLIKEVRTTQPRELLSLAFANSLPFPAETDYNKWVKSFWKGEIELDVQQGETIEKQRVKVKLRAPRKQPEGELRLDIVFRAGLASENWIIREGEDTLIIRLEELAITSILSPQTTALLNQRDAGFLHQTILYFKKGHSQGQRITEDNIDIRRSQPYFNGPSDMKIFDSPKEVIDALANLASAIKANMQSTED